MLSVPLLRRHTRFRADRIVVRELLLDLSNPLKRPVPPGFQFGGHQAATSAALMAPGLTTCKSDCAIRQKRCSAPRRCPRGHANRSNAEYLAFLPE
jgi:hypothetical protein